MLKKHKKKVNYTNTLCVFSAMVIFLIFYFIYMSKEHFKEEITPSLFADVSSRVMLIPDNSEIKKQYDLAFKEKLITYSEYYALNTLLNDYDNNIVKQVTAKPESDVKLNTYEKAVQNLKAYDDIGYQMIDQSKRSEVRELLVKEVNYEKLKMRD